MRDRAFDVLITSTASVLTRRVSDLESILADADASGVAVVTADGIVDTSTELGVMTARIMTRFVGRWDEGREEETHASAD
jgi:DNA invertase Pin-like site-specific DNA recombinase